MWRAASGIPAAMDLRRSSHLAQWLPSARLVAVGVLLVAAGLVFWPSSLALGKLWTHTQNRTYLHGYLILLISLWLIVRDRARLESAVLHPLPLALPALLLLSALWLIFWHAAVQDLHLVTLPLIILAALLATFGWAGVRVLWFPVCFILFAMPFWTDLVGILRPLSVRAVDALIWLTGLPAYMDGNAVRLPAGVLVIADGCSGVHFFMVGLAMAALFGELSRDSVRLRVIWLALMGALAMIANWIRIFVIAVVAYATDMRSPLIADHYWLGWVLFAVSFFGFLRIAERWAHPSHGEPERPQAAGVPARGATVSVGNWVGALACMAVLPSVAYALDWWRGAPQTTVGIKWPVEQGAWRGPEATLTSPWSPQFVNASAAELRQYVDARGRAVEILAVAYRSQKHGTKLVSFENSLLGKEPALTLVEEHSAHTSVGSWLEATVTDSAGQTSIIWAQYRIGDRVFVRPQLSQLWYGISSLFDQPLSSLVALRSACDAGCGPARARLEWAAAHLLPSPRLETAVSPGKRSR
jgi:EpsI family protein